MCNDMSRAALVVATRNEGKRREYELLFEKLPIDIKGLSDFPEIPPFSEEGNSFEEIARHKAQCASKTLNIPALADDSGLLVDVLNGAPGIFSARYAGESADDYHNNLKLLEALDGKDERNATFFCAIALAKPTGQALTYTGTCSGIILHQPVGTEGFGYDPLFYYPPLNKTFAQLSRADKNAVSHRGRAIKKLSSDLGKILVWLMSQ
jgi:XTP/dITP diphosphohydrolase